MREAAVDVGLEVSLRTVQRVLAGEVAAAQQAADARGRAQGSIPSPVRRRDGLAGPILSVGAEDLSEIRSVLRRAARARYLEFAGLDVEARPGEVILRARVYEPEDEYE